MYYSMLLSQCYYLISEMILNGLVFSISSQYIKENSIFPLRKLFNLRKYLNSFYLMFNS